jgi:hypothetical protein
MERVGPAAEAQRTTGSRGEGAPMKLLRTMPLLVLLVLSGCVTPPKVRSEYDHGADFARFHTFNFVSPLSTDKLGYSSIVTQQLKTAVTAQMEQRGYKLDPSPDLLVNFSGRLQEKTSIESTPAPSYGGYYGYRAGYYGAWPGYAMGSDVYTVHYTEGTLNVDLIDARTMQMVWEGVTVGEIKQKHLKDREATINKAVSNIFTKYPFQAGTAQPVATVSETQ